MGLFNSNIRHSLTSGRNQSHRNVSGLPPGLGMLQRGSGHEISTSISDRGLYLTVQTGLSDVVPKTFNSVRQQRNRSCNTYSIGAPHTSNIATDILPPLGPPVGTIYNPVLGRALRFSTFANVLSDVFDSRVIGLGDRRCAA